MRTIGAIFKKEFRGYFNSPMGYIYIVVFLVVVNWLFLRTFFIVNQATFRSMFSLFPWIFLLLVPAITMRLWAEEKKLGTVEILFTLPVKEHEILLGKYLSALAFLAISIALTLPLPLSSAFLGHIDWGQLFSSYIGALFLGGAYLSVGIFASALTENQIVAYILGALFTFVLFIISADIVLFTLPSTLASLLQYMGLGYHYENLLRGVIDSRDIIYYLSVIVLFLYLNYELVEGKR